MSHVSLGVSVPKPYPKGYFVANWYIEGKTKKSKTVSLSLHSAEIAYETVDLWAEDIAKEHNIPYHRTSFEELSERIADVKAGRKTKWSSPKTEKPKTPTSNLGNIKFFKFEINRAFKEFGADKVRACLKEGSKRIGELERERIKVAKNSNKAKLAIAQAMYTTFIDTGVDTSVYCNDDDIINEFNKLRDELPLT